MKFVRHLCPEVLESEKEARYNVRKQKEIRRAVRLGKGEKNYDF